MVEFHLHRAAQDGDLEKVKHFIQEGMFIDSPDDNKYTPLHWAAKCGRLEVAEFLISQNCGLDFETEDGSTAVLLAAECGQKSVVELLLLSGADPDGCSDIGGWTLLHYAARGGWTDAVKYLVENDAELDPETTLGMTPLLLAAQEGHLDVIELLLSVDADVDAQDQQVGALLHYAASRGWLQIVKKVVDIYWADIDLTNEQGNTPLHIACGMHNMDIVKELLKAGADASIKNKRHERALMGKTIHEAAETGDVKRLEYLMQLGVSIESWADAGYTPLDYGARSRIFTGFTPLHMAARFNQLEVAKFLIQHNCNLNPIANENLTPVMVAAFDNHEEFVDLLIKSGADISICISTKTTLLHMACAHNWMDIIPSILEKSNVNIEAKTIKGSTPLTYASANTSVESTKLLLQAGANIHGCDKYGMTALHLAFNYEYELFKEEEDIAKMDEDNAEVVETLLLAGADPNRKNTYNKTALHLAIENPETPRIEIIKLLIKHGAYLKYPNSNKIWENNPLKELVLNDVDLCTQLIINKFNHQSLPVVYKNPGYVSKLPRIDKMNIGKNVGVRDGIAACVQSEIQARNYCNVLKIRPTVLILMCVEALINPQKIKKKRSSRQASNKIKDPVKRSAKTLNSRYLPFCSIMSYYK